MIIPETTTATASPNVRGHLFARVLPLLIIILLVHSVVICECLVQQQQHHRSIHITPASREELYPPLILLGGIAQTKSSWDHHLVSLARNRRVLVYECLGQGDHTIPSDDADVHASLPAQAQILLETLGEVLVTEEGKSQNKNDPVVVDIAGFSFGGRVAMATACLQNDRDHCQRNGVRIRRLHLTGVGCDRSDFGHLAMLSFPDVVRNDPSLRSFAWSILLATYSSGYLRSLPETTLERFLDHIASSNHPGGLLAILEQAEVKDTEDPWHVANMADRLAELSRSQSNPNSNNNSNNNTILVGKLCVGEMDAMAPVDEVERLREKSDWIQKEVDVLPDCGHAVVLEQPRAWRESVLSFLNDNNTDDGNGST